MTDQNSMAIAVFCSRLCTGDGVKPLEPREWNELEQAMAAQNLQPSELLMFSQEDFQSRFSWNMQQAERMVRLIDRSVSLSFELSRYENMGIHIMTRADEIYPVRLREKLSGACPPLFYYAGTPALLTGKGAGYAGSRNASDADIAFTRNTVQKTTAHGYLVVTGGAKGVDHAAEEAALDQGGEAIAFLSDSMLGKIKDPKSVYAVQQGRLLLLSAVNPDSGFHAGIAMMRNRFVYAQSEGTVVVRSDYEKGGTWAGAADNLKKEWCPMFCWNNRSYRGNQALIENGAIPIDEAWDGNLAASVSAANHKTCVQMSLFDSM